MIPLFSSFPRHKSRKSRLPRHLVTGVGCSVALFLALPAAAQQYLSCGADPAQNTLSLQQAINDAAPGSTLVLPPGPCVVAKCDVATGAICYGPLGRHSSALNIGRKQNLIIQGAADGTSVLKLDPNPPYGSDGRHAYCPDVHLISTHLSKFLTFRGFTLHGADGELPEDVNQCPNGTTTRRIAEHMHGLLLLNTSDVTIQNMIVRNAHGDGINMIAEYRHLEVPRTERVSIKQTQFLDNDRAGISFQRNVGFVTIQSNYFRNSGQDQDIDMEPTGGKSNLGPYEITIDNNVFDRVVPGLTVTIGAANTVWSKNVRFTRNRIQRDPALPAVTTGGGGCVFINGAQDTYIGANRIIGDTKCRTLEAQKVTGLTIENNTLYGYGQVTNSSGNFVPRAVIDIAAEVGKVATTVTCGRPPLEPCPYVIHYAENVRIHRNTLTQQVKYSPVIEMRDVDSAVITSNAIRSSGALVPTGVVSATQRSAGIRSYFGLAPLPDYGYFTNKKSVLGGWSISANNFSAFDDALHIRRLYLDDSVANVGVIGNTFSSKRTAPRGIVLENAKASDAALIQLLNLDSNLFGCGLSSAGALLPNALVKPLMQTYSGNLGSAILCN